MEFGLYFGNCLELIKNISDKSIDLIFADLPYGQTAQYWDEIIDMKLLWPEYNRIVTNDGIIALFSAQPFTTMLISSNLEQFKYCWYWEKNRGTNFFHAKRMPIRKIEEICIFGGKNYYPQMSNGHIPTNSAKGCSNGNLYHGKNKRDYQGGSTERYPINILKYKCVDNYHRLHPNEKPIDLLEYIIKTYTKENEIVLDNVMGSGSTGIACLNTGRKFIGMENNNKYFEIATKRIKEHKIIVQK